MIIKNDDVDFIVLLAGPGMPIDELMIMQSKLITESMGGPKELHEANRKVLKEVYTYIRENENQSGEELKPGLIEVFKNGLKHFPEEVQNQIKQDKTFFEKEAAGLTGTWFLNFIRATPEDYLKKTLKVMIDHRTQYMHCSLLTTQTRDL